MAGNPVDAPKELTDIANAVWHTSGRKGVASRSCTMFLNTGSSFKGNRGNMVKLEIEQGVTELFFIEAAGNKMLHVKLSKQYSLELTWREDEDVVETVALHQVKSYISSYGSFRSRGRAPTYE